MHILIIAAFTEGAYSWNQRPQGIVYFCYIHSVKNKNNNNV